MAMSSGKAAPTPKGSGRGVKKTHAMRKESMSKGDKLRNPVNRKHAGSTRKMKPKMPKGKMS
jgi:hypothetical protein